MKRNENKIPEFDEIIFGNRNRLYGAYDLRKRYKSAASLSILGVVALSAILMIIISAFAPREASGEKGKDIIVILKPQSLPEPLVKQPEPPKPVPLTVHNRYVAPDVVDDTIRITDMMLINDFAVDSVQNGSVTDKDTVIYDHLPEIPVETEPQIIVQEMPYFPGGNSALLKYITENLVYPEEAQINNIQGRVVLKFVVKANGSVDRIEIMRSIDPLLDSEAVRVVKTLPLFIPGKQGGVAVPVWFSLPVSFKIENN
jgi:protein TonB